MKTKKKMTASSLYELQSRKASLEDRIKRMEADLRCPLEQDFSEQAAQLSNQLILKRLLEVEYSNLKELNREIELFNNHNVV